MARKKQAAPVPPQAPLLESPVEAPTPEPATTYTPAIEFLVECVRSHMNCATKLDAAEHLIDKISKGWEGLAFEDWKMLESFLAEPIRLKHVDIRDRVRAARLLDRLNPAL